MLAIPPTLRFGMEDGITPRSDETRRRAQADGRRRVSDYISTVTPRGGAGGERRASGRARAGTIKCSLESELSTDEHSARVRDRRQRLLHARLYCRLLAISRLTLSYELRLPIDVAGRQGDEGAVGAVPLGMAMDASASFCADKATT